MIIAGKFADFGWTRLTVVIGAILLGSGMFLAGSGGSVLWIALTLGAMTSLGCGFAYGTIIGTMVRWFPERRGFASGLAVGAVGVGPIVLAPLAEYFTSAYGVLNMFKIMGFATFIAMGLAALYVTNPPANYAPAGWLPKSGGAGGKVGNKADLDWFQIIFKPLFWLLYLTYIAGAFAGILVNGLAAPIAIELAGFDSAAAKWAVMLFAFANAGGRGLWGFLSDRLGRVFMLGVAFVITAIAMFVLYGYVSVPGFYLPCLMAAGLCYGGVLGTFPSLSADSFGIKNAAINLAVLFTAFSVAALLAPQVVAYYRNGGPGQYPYAFLVAACITLVGLVLSIIVAKWRRNDR
jgi:OFA family oxalate/formate antiporter-like MFS transporter